MKSMNGVVLKAMTVWFVLSISLTASCEDNIQRLTSPGILSTNEQRALTMATERAIEQAGLDASFLGDKKLYLDVRNIGAADLGRQHVAGMLVPLLENQGAIIEFDESNADSILITYIRIAGVERERKGDWNKTRGDVELGFQRKIGGNMIEKRGIGSVTITYDKGLFGMFPNESIR